LIFNLDCSLKLIKKQEETFMLPEDAKIILSTIKAFTEEGLIKHTIINGVLMGKISVEEISSSDKASLALGDCLYYFFKKMKLENYFVGNLVEKKSGNLLDSICEHLQRRAREDDVRKPFRRLFVCGHGFDRELCVKRGTNFLRNRSKLVLLDTELKRLEKSLELCARNGVKPSRIILLLGSRADFHKLHLLKEKRKLDDVELFLLLPLEEVFAEYFSQKLK